VAKYFEIEKLAKLSELGKQIYQIRTQCLEEYGIDILSTDNLSALPVYNIVSKYDTAFNVNFARNGEDAISNGNPAEIKNVSVLKAAGSASFMFHAMGDLAHTRYIFVVRLKSTLEPIRLYDIREQSNVAKVQQELERLKQDYLKGGFRKFDGIYIKESFFLSDLTLPVNTTVDNCTVIRDY
jgi:hypothetical protein